MTDDVPAKKPPVSAAVKPKAKKPRLSPAEATLRAVKLKPLPGDSTLKWAKPIVPATLPTIEKIKSKLPTQQEIFEILDAYEATASQRRSAKVLDRLANFLSEQWEEDQAWISAQTRSYRALLASVVYTAVSDACSPPLIDKVGKKRVVKGMNVQAFTAMRFIFDTSVSGLDVYASWLDFDAGQFRQKILVFMQDRTPGSLRGFTDMQRINFCRNYRLWQDLPADHVPNETDENEDDDNG